MCKVLITGGAGFIGSNIVNKLYKEAKHEIVVLDNFSEQIHGENYEESYLYHSIKGKCEIIKGDVQNKEDIEKALNGVDYILHLAAETGTGQSMYEIDKYTAVNITGTANLFDVILNKKINIKKIILSSSRSVYGEGMYHCEKHGMVVPKSRTIQDLKSGDFSVKCPECREEVKLCFTNEECKADPISYYAYTKLAQEKMLETMCPMLDIDYTIFRYQNVYGAGQSLNNPYTGIISIFSKLLIQGKQVNIFEDGQESRDFVHVSDVADITCNAIENRKTDGKYINVGYGKSVSVMEVAQVLKRLYNSKSEIFISGDFRKGDIRHNIADITNAKELCGFSPKYNFEKGMKEFVAWVNSQNANGELLIEDDKFEKSIKEAKVKGMLIQG